MDLINSWNNTIKNRGFRSYFCYIPTAYPPLIHPIKLLPYTTLPSVRVRYPFGGVRSVWRKKTLPLRKGSARVAK